MTEHRVKLSPSMMCADFFNLSAEVRLLEQYQIDWLHIDIMDGRYVPNFTLGTDYCRALAAKSKIPLDFHLMIEEPNRHVEIFRQFPGARVTFHPETIRQPIRLIEQLREAGISPGVALDPAWPVESFRHLLPLVDQVLIMTVSPGYAGQKLLPHCLPKITEARDFIRQHGLSTEIEVDGNVSWQNIPKMIKAGADILVVGTSALFEKHRPREESLKELLDLLAKSSG